MIYFRFPFSDKICTTDESSSENLISFFSFDLEERSDFKGGLKEISFEEFSDLKISSEILKTNLLEFSNENQEQYEEKIAKVIEFIKEEKLRKLVISRKKLALYDNQNVDFVQSFLNLCATFPNAFVYFFNDGKSCWMGAFSEVLGKFNKKTSEFDTMSLAGTLPINENWSPKEIEEQKPVTDYILSKLKLFSNEIQQSETYDHISGNIKHLRTDFKIKIDSENLEKLISELHPTPAVCGFPVDVCKNAIMRFEKFNRGFYAGYIRVETQDSVQYFVNLRCAEFLSNAAIISVGGGITAESSPEKEWRETELKSEAIIKNLAFIQKNNI